MKAKYVIGTAVIILFMVWGTSAFFKTTIQYVSLAEAKTADRIVQVMGKIDFDMVNYDADESRLEFAVYDPDAVDEAVAERLAVHYYGVVPGNFDQATSVVLKGQFKEDIFEAEQMLVKCPSKYQAEGGEEYQDMKEHNEATGESGT